MAADDVLALTQAIGMKVRAVYPAGFDLDQYATGLDPGIWELLNPNVTFYPYNCASHIFLLLLQITFISLRCF